MKKVVTIDKRKHNKLQDLIKQIGKKFDLDTDKFEIEDMKTEKQFKKNKDKHNLELKILNPAKDVKFNFTNLTILIDEFTQIHYNYNKVITVI